MLVLSKRWFTDLLVNTKLPRRSTCKRKRSYYPYWIRGSMRWTDQYNREKSAPLALTVVKPRRRVGLIEDS